MKLFPAQAIREWDIYTIRQEPVSSIELMERAARACVDFIRGKYLFDIPVIVFCGKGNNGGDGLAIARLLYAESYKVQVYTVTDPARGSADFQLNYRRLGALKDIPLHICLQPADLPFIPENALVIDALLGTGLSGAASGWLAQVIQHINQSKATVIAIDIPSGLPADPPEDMFREPWPVVKAAITLSFQQPKLSFLFAETAVYAGNWQVLDIGLHPQFAGQHPCTRHIITADIVKGIYRPRPRFGHKGTFGHALLIGGSFGKMGAMVLSSQACLHTGCGLVTAYIPKVGYTILQTAFPEAMVLTDSGVEEMVSLTVNEDTYKAIGIGPGVGTSPVTIKTIARFMQQCRKPLVIDADALNIAAMSLHQDPAFSFPLHSILTPHPGEFDRLTGQHANSLDRYRLALEFAKKYQVFVVLKGACTVICTPTGDSYFNSTGNAGMATGGSGDVLTGIITSLLAQEYMPLEAAIMGVYLHGLAGDKAAARLGQESMIASDIISHMPQAFHTIR